jgi:formylglycine-generating enzyme required for sulfatase activity
MDNLLFALQEERPQLYARRFISVAIEPVPQTSNPLLLTLALGVTMELVRVPAGKFLMGSADSDKDAEINEKPQHTVSLDEYLIGKYDVTNAQFRVFVQATGYKTTAETVGKAYAYDGSNWVYRSGADWQHPWGSNSTLSGKDNHPVVCISLDDAVAFSKWATQVTGRKVTLPTEAQWEKAARGTDGRIYPWGNQPPDSSRLNFGENVKDTTEAGKYSPAGDSPYGAADMAGNVWQFTADWYDEKYYAISPVNNPQGPALGQYLVLRGGSWGTGSRFSRSAYRSGDPPDYFTGRCGFRIVVAYVS